jgi:hypothetical protein
LSETGKGRHECGQNNQTGGGVPHVVPLPEQRLRVPEARRARVL